MAHQSPIAATTESALRHVETEMKRGSKVTPDPGREKIAWRRFTILRFASTRMCFYEIMFQSSCCRQTDRKPFLLRHRQGPTLIRLKRTLKASYNALPNKKILCKWWQISGLNQRRFANSVRPGSGPTTLARMPGAKRHRALRRPGDFLAGLARKSDLTSAPKEGQI